MMRHAHVLVVLIMLIPRVRLFLTRRPFRSREMSTPTSSLTELSYIKYTLPSPCVYKQDKAKLTKWSFGVRLDATPTAKGALVPTPTYRTANRLASPNPSRPASSAGSGPGSSMGSRPGSAIGSRPATRPTTPTNIGISNPYPTTPNAAMTPARCTTPGSGASSALSRATTVPGSPTPYLSQYHHLRSSSRSSTPQPLVERIRDGKPAAARSIHVPPLLIATGAPLDKDAFAAPSPIVAVPHRVPPVVPSADNKVAADVVRLATERAVEAASAAPPN